MELMYPIVIIICLVFVVGLVFIKPNKKTKYTEGNKVANTEYIKQTDYYKAKVKKYNILLNLVKWLSAVCIIVTSILIARPITVQTKAEEKYNRDILLGLDISTSQCKVNLELIKKFRNTLSSIEGDRIGIILYNTAPVVYCPLTDDYNYINECFDVIEEQLNIVIENDGRLPVTFDSDEKETQAMAFWNGGTVANSAERGSSLVGDGLARDCVFISKHKKGRREN